MREPGQLAELVDHPEAHLKTHAEPPRLSAQAAAAFGVGATTRLNDLIAEAAQTEPAALFDDRRWYHSNAERMRWERTVKRLAQRYGLLRPTGRPTGGPHRPRGFTIDDLRTLLDLARGTHRDAPNPSRRLDTGHRRDDP